MNRLKILFLTIFIITPLSTTGLSAVSDRSIAISRSSMLLNIQDSLNDDIEELIKTAFQLYKEKKYEEAMAICKKAQELSPSDYRPSLILGFIYSAQKEYKSAIDEYVKSISLKPTVQAYMLKAYAEQNQNQPETSVASFRKAIELEPNLADAYWAIGDILISDEKQRDEAILSYQTAIKLDSTLIGSYEYLGERILYAKKDEKLAEYIFRKQMAADEKRMIGRFALGRLLVKQRRLKEARELWNGRTSSEDKTMPNFITVLERAERLQLATEELAKNPDNPEILLKMGFAVMDGDHWVVDGRQEKAIENFRKALKIKPDFAMAQYAICKAYVQIADTYKSKNKELDEELLKLRKLDTKLAQEIEEYRKTYKGGLMALPSPKTKS